MTRATKTNILLIILFLLQIADGALTYIGVKTLGLNIEANPFIRELIFILGPAKAISIVKITAMSILTAIGFTSDRVKYDIYYAIILVTFSYVSAVLGWIYILFI